MGDASLMELFSDAEGSVLIGSDPDEWVVGGGRVKAVLSDAVPKQRGIAITAGDVRAFVEGSVGWASDNASFTREDGSVIQMRFTVVFHREAGEWKLVQMHSSI